MKISNKYLVAVVTILAVVSTKSALAASATGTAKQKVITALSISNTSDLDFGTATPGTSAKTVAAGSSENAENGSFAVAGQPNTTYTISLPADNSVFLTTGAGGSHQTISINSFTSSPSATGSLNGSGTQNLFVGATRSAMDVDQATGDYTGTYTVTVVY